MAVPVEVAGDQAVQRRDLRNARERFKMISAIWLAEEYPAAKFRRCEPVGLREFVLAENFAERCTLILVPSWITFQHRWYRGSHIPKSSPRVEFVSFVVAFDQLIRTITFEITGEQKRRMRGIGAVLCVQPDVADCIVHSPVTIEICGGNRGPPTG